MIRYFSFRIYTLFEAFLFLVFVCCLFVGCMALAGKYLHPHLPEIGAIGEAVLKLFLVLLIVGAFAIAKNVVTTTLTVRIDNIGLLFEFERSKLGLKRRDVFFSWQELKGWYVAEEHISGHTWSSPHMIFRSRKRRNFLFYFPRDEENEPLFNNFLGAFTQEIVLINEKNKGFARIKELSYDETSPISSIFVALLLFLPIPLFLYGIWKNLILLATVEDKLAIAFIGIIMILLAYLGVKMLIKAFKNLQNESSEYN